MSFSLWRVHRVTCNEKREIRPGALRVIFEWKVFLSATLYTQLNFNPSEVTGGSYKRHGWKEFRDLKPPPSCFTRGAILKRIFTSREMITVIAFQTCQVVKERWSLRPANSRRLVFRARAHVSIARLSFDRADATFMGFCTGHYSETTTQFKHDVNTPFYRQ